MTRALVIHPDGTSAVVDVATGEPEALQRLVGGWLEGVGSPEDRSWHAYCDEEGKLKGLPRNPLATMLARELGWPGGDILVGPVVFVGQDGPTAVDVPEHVLAAADLLA